MSEYITYHDNVEQGSDAWYSMRCGLLTASEVSRIITPTLKIANNEKTRIHLYELMAQRITKYVEPSYVSESMTRGHIDEIDAREKYSEKYSPVTECGFVTNNKHGLTIGYSPDGLVGDDGLIECKSRAQRFQVQTIVENVINGTSPDDFMLQVQTGLIVAERKWCDLISYSGGLPMATMRVYPDERIAEAIIEAAQAFEASLQEKLAAYNEAIESGKFRLVPTERREYDEDNGGFKLAETE